MIVTTQDDDQEGDMQFRRMRLALILAPLTLGACAAYGPPPPPPPGYAGEGWGQHVRRCERRYPRYNPRTDMIERPSGPVPCPL